MQRFEPDFLANRPSSVLSTSIMKNSRGSILRDADTYGYTFIEEEDVIRKILEHLKLWKESEPRPPPAVPEQVDLQYVPATTGSLIVPLLLVL